jgi:hypothetical protein
MNWCVSGYPVGAEVGVTYSCSRALGAILLPRAQTARVNLRDTTDLRQYIKENIDSWYNFVRDQKFGEEQAPEGSITLVYGCDKSASWAVAAFTERSINGSIFFNGGIIAGASPVSPQLRGSWSDLRRVGAESREGSTPESASGFIDSEATVSGVSDIFPSNCRHPIFVRTYRIKRKIAGLKWPLRIRAGAGPRNLDGDNPPENAESPAVMAVLDDNDNDHPETSLPHTDGRSSFEAVPIGLEQVWATLDPRYIHSTLSQISKASDNTMAPDSIGAEEDWSDTGVDIDLEYYMVSCLF